MGGRDVFSCSSLIKIGVPEVLLIEFTDRMGDRIQCSGLELLKFDRFGNQQEPF